MRGKFLDVTRHMIDGYALHEIICDAAGRPVDCRFLEINPAFERLTGFTADRVIGRTLLEIMPQTEPVWIERFGNVALTGQELHCEDYSREVGRYFEVKVYRPKPGQVACVFVDITDRKLAEQSFAESEERYRRLVEGLGEKFSVFSHTTDGVFLYVSRNFHRLFGIAENEIIGKNWRSLNLTPESLAAGEGSDRRVIEEQVPQTVELTSIHPDGSRRVIEVTYGPVLQDGHVAFIEGICRDITERKQHAAALRLKNLVFDASLAANSIADASGVLTEANASFVQIWGYATKDEVVGRPIASFLQNQNESEAIINALNGMGEWEGDFTAKRKDGSFFPCHGLATVIRNDRGEIAAYQSSVMNFTERKRAEELLRENTEKSSDILETSTEWIWEIDLSGNHTYTNGALKRFLGYSIAEFSSRNYAEFIHAEDLAEVERALPRYINEKRGWQGWCLRWRHKDGSYRWLESNAKPVVDASGQVIGFRGADRDITGRKRIEEELRKGEAHLQSVFRAAPIGVGVVVDRVFKQVNKRMCEMTGYSNEELVGQKARMLYVCDDDYEYVGREKYRQIGDLGTGMVEARWKCKAGHIIDVLLSSTPIDMSDPSKEVVFTALDITERKQSETTFKKLFSDSSDAILLIDSSGVFVECNQAALDLLKMTRQQFLLLPPALISPEFQPDGRRSAESAPEMIALAHSKGRHRFDWTCVNAEGGEFVVEVSLMPIVIKGQTMLHTTWRDITERKRLEGELLHSRERLHNILTLLPQSIFEADFEGRLTFANQTAFDLYGYTMEDLSAGLSVLNMVIPEDVDRARENIGKLYMGSEEGSHEYTAQKKDGTTFPALIYSSVIRKDGSPSGLRGTIVDISKRKKYEEELEKARDMAESMSRAKDEFLANMSHELRTPITAVLGFAEMLEDTDLSEEQHRYLGTIASSTETLLALVDDLLDLARIEAGKVCLEREEFSLRKLISEVADSQNPAAKAKGLAFRTQVPAEVPDRLMGDSLRLKQVLLNLTVNAIKFSARGEVCLSVTVEKSHPTTPMLRFDVADTGIGISAENLAGIFQPFSQVDPSSTRKFSGAGLGLAICTKLMAIMGGEISVDSREGAGSTFHVHLPFEAVDIETEGGGTQIRCQTAVTEDTPLRVLLVEDHEISQYFFSEVLRRCGHHVELATNGAEALGKLQCRTYDLVLMDVQMPVMDGLEAVSKIREMEKVGGGHLPIIALTAHAMEKDRVEVLNKGFDGYVSKPMKINVLLDEVKRCLSLFR